MVFRGKAKTPTKNTPMSQKKGKKTPVKKAEIDEDLLDMSDDEEVNVKGKKVQNGNKTPKDKNGERRVSFQIPGGKTPAKTPQKDASFLGKKAPTPGAKGNAKLQQFKGTKKQLEEDDDDAEDDSEDDFAFEDMTDEDESDMEMGEDADEDDEDDEDEADDDDDEEADDDDDDEDEEEDAKPSPKAAPTPQKGKNQKTPAKSQPTIPKAVQEKTEKAKSPKQKLNEKGLAKAYKLDAENREQLEKVTLFVGHLPVDVTSNELKALSTSIKDVNIPTFTPKPGRKFRFAFLVFESEEATEKAHEQLQSATLRGESIEVDYVGMKSKKQAANNLTKHYDPKRLYVTGVPTKTTISEFAKFFPKAQLVSFSESAVLRTATVGFHSESDANEALLANKDTQINGSKLVVLHAFKANSRKHHRSLSHKRKQNKRVQNKRAKKMKLSLKDQ